MKASRETRSTRSRAQDPRDRPRNDRIGKLMRSEYSELSETVLVESPFAETTRNGRGLRQVALGLTPTRLIVAADVLRSNPGFLCPRGLDASIESFELVSVYPLEYVALSVFRRRRRRSLKARFVDGRANYYELGGARRRVFWGIWCEQIRRLLARRTDGSSLSETTAASSSSSSALYLLSSEIEVGDNRDASRKRPVFRIWTRYGGAGDYVAPVWTDKDLYLGPSFNELMDGHYTPVPVRFAGASLEDVRPELEDRTRRYPGCEKSWHSWPCQTRLGGRAGSQRAGGLCNVLFARSRTHAAPHRRDFSVASRKSSPCNVCRLNDSVGVRVHGRHGRCHECPSLLSEEEFKEHVEGRHQQQQQQQQKGSRAPLASKVSRFGFGVPEKCHSSLILGPCRGDPDNHVVVARHRAVDSRESIESGVTVWEGGGKGDDPRRGGARRWRHPRRYAFSSAAHFLHALGPWSVQPGERDTVQTLRSRSAVGIRRQPADPELRLPVSRRQLTASVSCAALTTAGGSSIVGAVTRGRVMLFWTPEYWYRPQAAAAAYRELRRHLASLQDFRRAKEKKRTRRSFFLRREDRRVKSSAVADAGGSSGLLERVLSVHGVRKRNAGRRTTAKEKTGADVDRGTAHLRRLLRMNLRITVWDLDSTTLATQLTMIDRDLFVRVPATEIEALIYQRSSRNAPNLGAWIAFSHRIACLAVSEILAIRQLDMRTRIMARLINAADKCHALGNFQSCRSILAGLQAPPIYRLRRSWSYLRTHHASRYETMEQLSKIYKSPRCSRYRRAWTAAARSPPYMPYVGHFLIKVLGLNGSSRREVRANVASSPTGRKRSTAQKIVGASASLALNDNNLDDPRRSGDFGRNSVSEPRRCLARRILAATLARIKFTARRNENAVNETEGNVWTRRQRYLARKFLHRWNVIALEGIARMRTENERRSRNVDPRRERILDVAVWLTNCQRFAQGYGFPLHSFACEFLLKARYREDRENFLVSLKLEPPTTS